MSQRNVDVEALLRALQRPHESFDESSRTLEIELERGLKQLSEQQDDTGSAELNAHRFDPRITQFAKDVLQFTYEQAKTLNLTPAAFRDTFGAQGEVEQAFQEALHLSEGTGPYAEQRQ